MIGKKLLSIWNPNVALAIVISLAVAGSAGYWRGATNMKNKLEAERLKTEQIAETAYQAAISAAAYQISQIKVENKTYRQILEREIKHEPVYLDCKHTPAVKRLLDAILTGEAPAESLGGAVVPDADAAEE